MTKIPDDEKVLICGYDPAEDRIIVCIGLKDTLSDGDVGQPRGVDALATIRLERDQFAEWLTGIDSWFHTIVPGVSGSVVIPPSSAHDLVGSTQDEGTKRTE